MKRSLKILLLALAMTLAAVPFQERIAAIVFTAVVMRNDAPPPECVEEAIDNAPDPEQAILAAWATGQPTHRAGAIYAVRKMVAFTNRIPARLQILVQQAAVDPIQDVREMAFRVLRICHDPQLASLAAAQLHDCDPEIRLLGAENVRFLDPATGMPLAAAMLDDGDPKVVVTAIKMMGRWAGKDFGVRMTDVMSAVPNEQTGLRELREGSAALCRTNAERVKAWWAENRFECPSQSMGSTAQDGMVAVNSNLSLSPPSAATPFKAPVFEAATLDSGRVNLSGHSGKVRVLHFWASPRAGAMNQLQEWGALQQRYGNQIEVVTFCLDTVLDDDGDFAGEDDNASSRDPNERHHPSADQIRLKVEHELRDFDVKLPVVLDEHFAVGGKFNAVEPPTTVIIDADGFIRREFNGCRPLPVLEAMLADAGVAVGASNQMTVAESDAGRYEGPAQWEREHAVEQSINETIAPWLTNGLTASVAAAVAVLGDASLRADLEGAGVSFRDLMETTSAEARTSRDARPLFQEAPAECVLRLLTEQPKRQANEPNVEVTKERIADLALHLVAETQEAFFKAQAQAQLTKLLKGYSETADRVAEVARRQFDTGKIPEMECRIVQSQAADARLEWMRAESERLALRSALAQRLNLGQGGWRLTSELPVLPSKEATFSKLYARALKYRPETKIWESRINSIASAFPLNASNSPAAQMLTTKQYWGVEGLGAERNRIESRIVAAVEVLSAARTAAAFAETNAAPLRRQLVDDVSPQYIATQISARDLLAAKRDAVTAEKARIETLRDYWLAWAALERIVGTEAVVYKSSSDYSKRE